MSVWENEKILIQQMEIFSTNSSDMDIYRNFKDTLFSPFSFLKIYVTVILYVTLYVTVMLRTYLLDDVWENSAPSREKAYHSINASLE